MIVLEMYTYHGYLVKREKKPESVCAPIWLLGARGGGECGGRSRWQGAALLGRLLNVLNLVLHIKGKWSIETYCAKVLLSIFHSTEDKRIPQRIKLIASVVHNSGQIVVNLFRSQRVSIIPHVVIEATSIETKNEKWLSQNVTRRIVPLRNKEKGTLK